ncbi:MAG: D-glycerate dehydrogenase [Cyclobacteriaceae bacterium]|nr:D-glycerate dehydrogenase [Cyclobacteriaceae bacterium]
MVRKRVFITRQIPALAGEFLAQQGFEVEIWEGEGPMPYEQLIERARHFDALISLGADKINEKLMESCPRLKIISQFAVGYDNIDVAAATRLGIPVGNTPDVLSEATADIAFGLLLAVSRKLFFHHKRIERGEWKYFEPTRHLGIELKGRKLGIFGMGRIGMVMARRCIGAYQMQVSYHNRTRNAAAEAELGARYVSFDELLHSSDVISVHCVLSPETRGIFDAAAFARMKPTAIFINTARGAVHREADLIQALQHRTIWGAGLDVTDPEPMLATNPLLQMEHVAVLPHVGSATVEARTEMARRAAENVIAFFQDGTVPYLVNPGVFPIKRSRL